MSDRVQAALEAFDGRHVAPLEAVSASPPSDDDIDTALAVAGESEQHQGAATWLLRAWLRKGSRLDSRQTAVLIELAHGLTDWEAVLHVCQLVEFLELRDGDTQRMWSFLEAHTTNSAAFVRAWAYNGLAVLGTGRPELRAAACMALDRGSEDDAASVRARVRRAAAALRG